jgi:putative aldouronate transport system substrate-binding protein
LELEEHMKRPLCILILALAFVSAQTLAFAGGTGESSGAAPTLKFYFIAQQANPDELNAVQAALNKLVTSKIGAKMELHTLNFQDVTTKIPLMLSSGDDVDLVSDSTFAPYSNAVGTGGLRALDDLLPGNAAATWKEYSKEIWNATRIDGKIYMVPSYKPQPSYAGVWPRKELVDKYHFDWQAPKKWEDWEPFFDAVLKNDPGVTPMLSGDGYWGRIWFPNYYGYDAVDKGVGAPKAQGILGVKITDKTRKIVVAPFTQEYRDSVTLMRTWYLKGYVLQTPPTGAEMNTMRSNLKFAAFVVPFVANWSTVAMGQNEWSGATILQARVQRTAIVTTSSVTGSGTSVTRVSKHPELAVKFIDQMFQSTDVNNLLNFGIEGKDYIFVDKAKGIVAYAPGVTGQTAAWNPNTYWQFGYNPSQYVFDPADLVAREKDLADMKAAAYSPVMGFTPSRDAVKNQIAAVISVCQQYGEPLELGLVDPDDAQNGLAVFQQKLKEAGIDDILADYQKQIDAWAAKNAQ